MLNEHKLLQWCWRVMVTLESFELEWPSKGFPLIRLKIWVKLKTANEHCPNAKDRLMTGQIRANAQFDGENLLIYKLRALSIAIAGIW